MSSKKIILEEVDDEEEIISTEIKVHKNHIYLYTPINTATMLELNLQIKKLSDSLLIYGIEHDHNPAPIYLHINSEGGEIYAALSVVDTIKNSKIEIHSIIEGCAASAATLISIVCHRRYITENSHMLIHQLTSGFWGKMNEIEDDIVNLNRLMVVMKNIYRENSNLSNSKLSNYLKKDILWSADTCVKNGLVDAIYS
jgi:ATP-dependent Clp endopeptidase proteolytic subunit ClpP